MSQKVSDNDFVVCWATSDTIDDVVKGTGLTIAGAQWRARKMRERGVRLMKLNGVHKEKSNVDELNKLVDKYSKVNRDLR